MSPRLVHLGAGPFARAHPWWATELASASGERWSVTAVARRDRRVPEALRSHGWAYDVRLRAPDGSPQEDRADRVTVVDDALVAEDDPGALDAVLADPVTRVLGLSVTEAAYPATAARTLDGGDPEVAEDLRDRGARSLPGRLVRAAQARSATGAPPLTVVVCDNVVDGGPLLRGLALDLAARTGRDAAAAALDGWRFPTTVVDRVVPRVEEGDQPDVVAERHFRWVLSEDVGPPGDRPGWEDAGAVVVPDAAPWSRAKLLLVNAPHSLLAGLGTESGHATVADAMADPPIAEAVERALRDELGPRVPAAPGLDVTAEVASTLVRFAGQRVDHPLAQIGAAGSAKLPQRLAAPLAASRADSADSADGADGAPATWSVLTLALWWRLVAAGRLEDPRSAQVVAAATGPARSQATALLSLVSLLPDGEDPGTELDDPVAERLAGTLADLADLGTRRTLERLLART